MKSMLAHYLKIVLRLLLFFAINTEWSESGFFTLFEIFRKTIERSKTIYLMSFVLYEVTVDIFSSLIRYTKILCI